MPRYRLLSWKFPSLHCLVSFFIPRFSKHSSKWGSIDEKSNWVDDFPKESLYYYNEENISPEIKNYLFAINFETGRTEKCVYTGDELDIAESHLEAIERCLLGPHAGGEQRRTFRKEVQNQYTAKTLTNRHQALEG